MLEASKKNFLIGSSCRKRKDVQLQEYKKNNLTLKHAYSVLKAIIFEKNRLILLKNP